MTLGHLTYRHADRGATVVHRLTTAHTVGRLQRDAAHLIVADLQLNLDGDRPPLVADPGVHGERVVDRRNAIGGELDVDDRADDPCDTAVAGGRARRGGGESGGCHGFSAPITTPTARPRHRRFR
ncbi:hypothetical protein SDC9_93437 [bioreactor metagenome]|uniref:Uncharacterized protein n=1 Tax=bioreactor metagenome TaxID=1076179 RepID=A0A645A3A6_9ZZZZ